MKVIKRKSFNEIIVEVVKGCREVLTLFEVERVCRALLKKGYMTKKEYFNIGKKILIKKFRKKY
jgi:hypothetical protein